MAAIPYRLAQVALGTVDTEIATTTTGYRWVITSIIYCNTTSAAVTARLHHVRPSELDSSSTNNAIAYDFPIAANHTVDVLGGLTRMVTGSLDQLRGLASTLGVTVTVYGSAEAE